MTQEGAEGRGIPHTVCGVIAFPRAVCGPLQGAHGQTVRSQSCRWVVGGWGEGGGGGRYLCPGAQIHGFPQRRGGRWSITQSSVGREVRGHLAALPSNLVTKCVLYIGTWYILRTAKKHGSLCHRHRWPGASRTRPSVAEPWTGHRPLRAQAICFQLGIWKNSVSGFLVALKQ